MVLEKIAPAATIRQRWLSEWSALRDALAADGWEFDARSSRLTPIVPEVAMSEELNGLEVELEQRGWSTAGLHYRRAANGYGSGDWESANSQLRSFLEDFLSNVAERATGKRPKNPIASIQTLPDDLVDNGERELLKGLWALCNERGSHPGEPIHMQRAGLRECDDLPLGRGHVFEHGLAEACLGLLAGHPNLPRHAARLGEFVRRHRTQPKGREVSRPPSARASQTGMPNRRRARATASPGAPAARGVVRTPVAPCRIAI